MKKWQKAHGNKNKKYKKGNWNVKAVNFKKKKKNISVGFSKWASIFDVIKGSEYEGN